MTSSEYIAAINTMSHYELARMWRFTPLDNDIGVEVWDRLKERLFVEHEGITPEISKQLGWGKQ